MKKLLYLALAAVILLTAYDDARPVKKVPVRVAVAAGDTLWTLVVGEMEKVGDRRDIRLVIDETEKLNGLTGALLPVGKVIEIPLEVQG